jgi:hypothetical protein
LIFLESYQNENHHQHHYHNQAHSRNLSNKQASQSACSSQTRLNLLSVSASNNYDHQQGQGAPSGGKHSLASAHNKQSQWRHQERAMNDLVAMGLKRPRLVIKRGARGFGFVLRAIKVYTDDDTPAYTIQHLVIQVDEQGPAHRAGLRANDLITHVNDQVVCGKMHPELIKLIMANHTLAMHTCQLSQSNVRTNGRRRLDSPSSSAAARLARPYTNAKSGAAPPPDQSAAQTRQQFRPVKTYFFRNGHPSAPLGNRTSTGNAEPLAPPPPPPPVPLMSTGSLLLPAQPVIIGSSERKKKTLLRKVSEKGAKKYNFVQPQHMAFGQYPPQAPQQQVRQPSCSQLGKLSSSSSSSSSSLNNSFNMKNMCGTSAGGAHASLNGASSTSGACSQSHLSPSTSELRGLYNASKISVIFFSIRLIFNVYSV